MSRTALYCYHGDKYEAEALTSMHSLSKHNPDVSIVAVAPLPPIINSVKFIPSPFTTEFSGFAYKVNAIARFESKKFLFLDTDTHIVADLGELFNSVDSIGIAGVADPLVDTFIHIPDLKRPSNWKEPKGYIPEINSGVLMINREKLPSDFMLCWLDCHNELCNVNSHLPRSNIPDQPSLRQALIQLDVIPLILGNEFNFRACYPQTLYRSARIVHVHRNARTAHYNGGGIDGDVVTTYPFGGAIARNSILNRGLYWLRREIFFRFTK